MAETTYKKGELLFEGDITTTDVGNGSCAGFIQIQTLIPVEENMIISFNGTEYTCERIAMPNDNDAWVYGGFTPQGPVFTDYPFAFLIYESGQYTPALFTENPGTYSIKIYIAIPDSDSSSEPVTIRSYIDKNLTNLNWNILPQIFESEGVELTEEIERYLRETPKNTNWNVFNSVGSSNSTDEGLVIIDGTPVATYQSGGDYTSIGFLFESEPVTLPNIKVGTTFTVEINNQSYNFTIAIVNTESGSRNYASAQSATVPSFSLSDTIEGFACQMFIEGDITPITHFKVIQTSDYKPVNK